MKRLSALLLGALALGFHACEKHPASQLPDEHATQFGEHAAGHGGHHAEHKAHGKPVTEAAIAAPAHGEAAVHAPASATPPAAAEVKTGEAPKFFPDKK